MRDFATQKNCSGLKPLLRKPAIAFTAAGLLAPRRTLRLIQAQRIAIRVDEV